MIPEHKLREIPLLADVPSEELVKLASLIKERRVPKGSYIVYADDPGPSMMFLGAGRAKVTLASDDGKEIVIAHLSKGDFFGEIAVLTGEDRSANVVAASDCLLYVLSDDEFRKHVLENNGLSLAIMKELALRLRQTVAKIGDLALYDVYRRVARTLKSMAEPTSENGEEKLVIAERPTHQELAAMVGTSREMVTRALKGLEEDRCIVITDKRIEVLKMPI